MKQCNTCKKWKDKSGFSKSKYSKDGLQYKCNQCIKDYYKENRDRILQYHVEYLGENKERINRYQREHYQKNKESIKQYQAEYLQMHLAEHNATGMKRYALKKNALPVYADLDAIKKIYRKSHLLSLITGIKYHVDHIIPLKGRNVCGLHIETNLQILSASENCSKHNKFVPFFENVIFVNDIKI